MKKKLIGYAPVDSGQLIIIDPCYLGEWKDGKAFPKEGEPSNHYAKACKATTGKAQAGEILVSGIAGNGVVFCSGWGDGNYPVSAVYSEDGHIKSVRID